VLNLDDAKKFVLIHHFHIPAIYTWGDRAINKREEIRRTAQKDFSAGPFNYGWYGFRIKAKRNKFKRDLDLEDVPKLIIDSFSGWQIDRDRSTYPKVKLYDGDELRGVRAIQIEREFISDNDETAVWIFGKKG